MMDFGEDAHLLGDQTDVYFDAFNLDAVLSPERLTISTANGFSVILPQTPGTKIGNASIWTVPTAGGQQTEYDGSVVVVDATTFTASASAQACAPGTHTGMWQMQLSSSSAGPLTVAVAVDWTGSAYKMTMCFDDQHAQSVKVSEIYFAMDNMFKNPTVAGRYLFDGVVTPFGSDGNASPTTAYELQAYALLPQILTATATYNRTTKIFTVSGVSIADGKPRVGVNVHVYAGRSESTTKLIGAVLTGPGGKYRFTKKLPIAPVVTYGHIDHYYHQFCSGTSQPGGCVTDTTDGRSTFLTRVKIQK